MLWRERTEQFFRGLQDRICSGLEELDGAKFREDLWSREGGRGPDTRHGEGRVFEKAGVNFSAVAGTLPEEFAAKIRETELPSRRCFAGAAAKSHGSHGSCQFAIWKRAMRPGWRHGLIPTIPIPKTRFIFTRH